MATDTDTAMTEPTLLASATAQMEAIRDQWLRPLVDRIEELSRENGRLQQERDSLRIELDRMRLAPDDAPQERDPASVCDVPTAKASESPTPSGDTLALGWRRWFRRITGGK